MYKNFIKKIPINLCVGIVCGAVVYKNFQETSLKPHYANYNYSRRFYPASSEYPEIIKNKNIMARNLTLNLYAKLRDLRTPNGFTIDDAIQTGVDNPGKYSHTGIVAGDEETYKVFSELFDKIIYDKHGYKSDQLQPTDLDYTKLENASFQPEYVKSIRIRAIRNVRGYCLPSFCTRGERRDVESILVKALYALDNVYKGVYYSIKELSPEEEATLANNNLYMEKPWEPEEMSSNLGKDWPDARGIWLSHDKKIAAYINRNDHILISCVQSTTDFKESFINLSQFLQKFESKMKSNKWNLMKNKHLGNLTTDPKNLGTGMKFSVRIKLPLLSKDGRLGAVLKLVNLNQSYRIVDEIQHRNMLAEEDDRKSSILEIASKTSLGKSEVNKIFNLIILQIFDYVALKVEIAQDFVDSINKLIQIEKTLEKGGNLEVFLYKK